MFERRVTVIFGFCLCMRIVRGCDRALYQTRAFQENPMTRSRLLTAGVCSDRLSVGCFVFRVVEILKEVASGVEDPVEQQANKK